MNIDKWIHHISEAYQSVGASFSSDKKAVLSEKLSENVTEAQKKVLTECKDVLTRFFFKKAARGEMFGSLGRVKEELGQSLEENYGLSSGPFMNMAKTYWTYKLEVLDVLPGYHNLALSQILANVERDIASVFFPTPGLIKFPVFLRKYQQRQLLKKYAPEMEIERFLSENPMLKRKSVVREYAEAIIIAIILALIIRTFIVQAFKIPSGSMIPSLQVGDHILVSKFLYGTKIPFTEIRLFPVREPHRLDIIVFKFPEDENKDFIKRVIGIPGDTVEIRDKVIYLNGKPLSEPYAIHLQSSILPADIQPRDNFGPIVVPADSYFVMGDNRDQSLDSRFWGFVEFGKIQGKAFIVYWSWNGEESWVRWNRIGQLIS